MTYDFNTPCSRKGTGCIKWDFGPASSHPDPLPMWIADMDYPTPDFVLEGIRKRLQHPVFGYFLPDGRFYDSIIHWHRSRYGAGNLCKEQILISTQSWVPSLPQSASPPVRAMPSWSKRPVMPNSRRLLSSMTGR